jgi:hypothetical protein
MRIVLDSYVTFLNTSNIFRCPPELSTAAPHLTAPRSKSQAKLQQRELHDGAVTMLEIV